MKQLFVKILVIFALVLTTYAVETKQAHAQASVGLVGKVNNNSNKLFVDAENLVENAASFTQRIIYAVGFFGALALGTLAFFGKFNWTWLIGLIGGLVLIAIFDLGLDFVTGYNPYDGSSTIQPVNGGGTP
jgi:hypothetical protein